MHFLEKEYQKLMSATHTIIGNYHIYEVDFSENRVENSENAENKKFLNLLLLDNSGSMGSNTRSALDTFGNGIFGSNGDKELPGVVIAFDSNVKLYENIVNEKSIKDIKLPQQCCTDITNAFKTSIEYIENHQKKCPKDLDVHYILTFLSDGVHNVGPTLDSSCIKNFKKVIETYQVNLSIIVVGIASNDTKLGMLIKTSLETLPIESLKSVYYANGFREMVPVINEIVEGMNFSLKKGVFKNFSVEDGLFLDNNNNKNKFFSADDRKITICVKSENGQTPSLYCENEILKLRELPFDVSVVSTVINNLIPNLSRLKIAHGEDHIKEQVKNLDFLIEISEQLIVNMGELKDVDLKSLKPNDRLKLFKLAKGSKLMLSEERNKLQNLSIKINNDSAVQANYLVGMQKKYASKAVATSQMIDVSLQDVLNEIKNILPLLKQSIENDTLKCFNDVNNHSMLSLSTPIEQFTEWLDLDSLDINCLYTLLVSLGFTGYPIKFRQNNAVQMDPFQTKCTYIEPFLIDSCSVLLANQLEKVLTSPSRTEFKDILVLVDPSCPQTSKLLIKTFAYKYLASITLCRDLYMYKGSMMHSMHSHGLMSSLQTYGSTKSTIYLELCLRIIYSFKKLWNNGEKSVALFTRWWDELSSITSNSTDNCNHPIQLLLLLAVNKVENYDNFKPQLINLLNEVLARNMKMKFNEADRSYSIKVAQKIFKVYAEESPQPGDDLMVEPRPSAVKETCKGWTEGVDIEEFSKEFGKNGKTIKDYLNTVFLPYVRMFEFIRIVCKSDPSWIEELEQTGKFSSTLMEKLKTLNEVEDTFKYLDIDEKVINTMFLQALLHFTSDKRDNITEKFVEDSETFREMIVYLRMEHYQKSLSARRSEMAAYFSNIPLEDILNWDIEEFIKRLGSHTHGLSKQEFWAYLKASSFDEDREAEFMKKSNSCTYTALAKVKCSRGAKIN